MIIRIDYSNADGTRAAQVLRRDDGNPLGVRWDVVLLTGHIQEEPLILCRRLTQAQAEAREWTR